MTVSYSPKVEALRTQISDFMAEHIYPNEKPCSPRPIGRGPLAAAAS